MKNLRIGAIGAALLMVAAACGGSSSSSADTIPFKVKAYPEAGPAECSGAGFKRISSTDASTVVFELCEPDVAFLSKLALTNFVINDSGYLSTATQDGSIVENPNGTGPYKFSAWQKGQQIVLTRNNDYWGKQLATSGTAVVQWAAEAPARLIQLKGGFADGIDNVAVTDDAAIAADPSLKLVPREGLNIFYLGMNSGIAGDPFEKVEVRKAVALALDRQRIVDNFYRAGSEVATHFTPCSFEFACEGDDWYSQDIAAAKELMASAGYPNGFKTEIAYRNVTRGYLPSPATVAADIQDQLKAIGITVTIKEMESTAFLDAASAGSLVGLHMLGWGADYTDPTNFLDYHFGQNASPQFGQPIPAVYEPLAKAAKTSVPEERAALYAEANNALRENVPMIPIAHGASALAYAANIVGAHSSPLGNEEFAAMGSGGDDVFVFTQSGEPGGLYCADESDGESLRVCGQISEGLYGFVTGTATLKPVLATGCTPSEDGLTWTCTLRTGVTFHNGASFDATDVVDSFASIWDCANPWHKGRTSVFEYWSLLSSFLNADSCTKPE